MKTTPGANGNLPLIGALALAVLSGTGGTRARAALWDGRLWALSADASVTGGYDSNILAVNDGPSDSFATYVPSLVLTRKDSALSVDAEAWTSWTTFLRETNNDSLDPGVSLKLSYPANVESFTTQAAEIHWVRTTTVNVDVGQRVSQDDALAKYEGDLWDSAKLSLVGRGSFDRDEFLGAAYTTIDVGSAGASVEYSPQELFRAGVGYDLTVGRSAPNSAGLGSLDQVEHAFTVQAQGEFTPKVTGKISAGGAYSDYTGSYTHSEWDTVVAADIAWTPRDRLTLDLQASRTPSFNADGDVDLASSLTLGITQDLPRGFSARIYGMGGYTSHERVVTYRKDSIEGAGASLSYNLTGRLTAFVGYDWTRQDSDLAMFTYRRDLVSGRITYRF